MSMKKEPKIFLGDAKETTVKLILFRLINHLDLL